MTAPVSAAGAATYPYTHDHARLATLEIMHRFAAHNGDYRSPTVVLSADRKLWIGRGVIHLHYKRNPDHVMKVCVRMDRTTGAVSVRTDTSILHTYTLH